MYTYRTALFISHLKTSTSNLSLFQVYKQKLKEKEEREKKAESQVHELNVSIELPKIVIV